MLLHLTYLKTHGRLQNNCWKHRFQKDINSYQQRYQSQNGLLRECDCGKVQMYYQMILFYKKNVRFGFLQSDAFVFLNAKN